MIDKDTKRISRLTAILTQLQTKRIVTAPELAEKYSVSIRTIYRDLKALEQSGVPIFVEEGKGFSLIEGYKIPPIMFTQSQANALILAEQLVLKNKDASFINDYCEAIEKIKAALVPHIQDKVNLLSKRTLISHNISNERNSNNLSQLQIAITHFRLTNIEYLNALGNSTRRTIEPFALLSTYQNWLLLAYCRLRQEFRYFRLDRISSLTIQEEVFEQHDMTLEKIFKNCSDYPEPLT